MPSGFNILLKIAIVEDHTLVRQALCRLIDTWDNCKVIIEVESALELVERIEFGNIPDIVLVDLQLTSLNGYETIKILASKFSNIKILVVTMYSAEESILMAFHAGAHGFVHKSEDVVNLRKAIFEIMRCGFYITDQAASKMIRRSVSAGKKMKHTLTDEEILFLRNLVTDKTYKEIAVNMKIAPRHVEYLRNILFERFSVQNRSSLATFVIEHGIIV